MTRRIVIVGAGIVGALVARELAADRGVEITVVERAPSGLLPGSTGHAPGFVGLYNEDEVHVPLAKRSAAVYDDFPAAFRRVGAFDIAETEAGAEQLRRRAEAATRLGLQVDEVPVAEAARRAPALVDPERAVFALHSPADGAADAAALTESVIADTATHGVRYLYQAPVRDIHRRGGSLIVEAEQEKLVADDVVLAAGLWGGALADLAGSEQVIVPVGHPYIYSAPQARQVGGPLVRFRERSIYARAHGERLGMGCYAHDVYDASAAVDGDTAEMPWPAEDFASVVAEEIEALPPDSRFVPDRRLNGVFSMTPDGRPYIGALPELPGLWCAQAVWVTHAGGAATILADMIRAGEDAGGVFSPTRFTGQDAAELRRRALALY